MARLRHPTLSVAAIVTTCAALLVASLVPAEAQVSPDSGDPEATAAGGPATLPAGNTFPIPAPYGVSFSDSWHACRDGCSRRHKGNDLMADEGTPVVAVESGVIAKVDGTDDGNGGLSVWLRGDSGVAYYYAHNSANLVVVGQRVARGQQIARVGHTGNARTTPSHVHFQINLCGEVSSSEPCTVDPHRDLLSWPQEQVDGGADAIGVYTPTDARLRLRTEGGSPLPAVAYGTPQSNRSAAGAGAGADEVPVPVAGDWNGDGRDTVGLYRPADASFHLRDDTGAPLPAFRYGQVGDLPLAGDWDGDGRDSVGVYRPADATFHLRDEAGRSLPTFAFGTPGGAGALPLAGDWDGDGRDTVALYRPSAATFVARDDSGATRPPLRYGRVGDLPLAGDWDGDGRDTVGVYRSADAGYHLRGFTDRPGTPITFGPPQMTGARPVAGDWNGRDLVTADDLHAIWDTAPDDPDLAQNLPLLNSAMTQAGVVTPARKAAFLATIRNESRFRFDAVERGRDEHRGRGFIQLTGEDNYRRAGDHLGLDLVDEPELVTNPLISAAVTSWYWTIGRDINLAADRLDMGAVNIAVGYRPSAAEDFERCADFIRALAWFSGGTVPDGVNCDRSLGAIATALATMVPDPRLGSDPSGPSGPVPPASVSPSPFALPPPPRPGPATGPLRPTTPPPSGPPGSTPTTTRPGPAAPPRSTTTTTEPPTTTTTTADTTTTTEAPASTTTTTAEPPTTTPSTVPDTTTTTEAPATTTTEAPPATP